MEEIAKTEAKMPQPQGLELDVFYSAERLKAMASYAEAMVASQAFTKGIANKFQAIAILQAGAEMGMAPMEAIGSFYIVNGKVSIYGAALSRQLRKHGWKIEFLNEEKGKKVTIKLSKGEESFEDSFDDKDPVLVRSQAMKNDPYSKLRWHGLARMVRFFLPEVMGGVSYLAEEAEDFLDSETTAKEVAPKTRTKKVFDQEPELEAKQEPAQPQPEPEPAQPQPEPAIDQSTGEILEGWPTTVEPIQEEKAAEPAKEEVKKTSKVPPLSL